MLRNSEQVENTRLRGVPLKEEKAGVFIAQFPSVMGCDRLLGGGGEVKVAHLCMGALDQQKEQTKLQCQPERVFKPRTANWEAEQCALKW